MFNHRITGWQRRLGGGGSGVQAVQGVSYRWDGFLQPINDTAHQTGVQESKFKLGQTIPAKFVLKNAAGDVVQQAANPTFTRSGQPRCLRQRDAALDTITEVVTPDAGVIYKWDGSQYHYNWSTKGLTSRRVPHLREPRRRHEARTSTSA